MSNGTTEFSSSTIGSPFYTLSRVLLNSLLQKSAKEREELQKQSSTKNPLDFHSVAIVRDHEVRWMLTLGRRFHLGLSTIGLAIAILDRILRLVKVQGKYVHCLSVAAMGLAVKFHEEIDADSEAFEANRGAALLLAIPSPEQLNADDLAAKIRANSLFSQQELNRMERTLLARLGWDLLLPSFDRFLQAMLAVIGAPHLAASFVLRRNFEVVMSAGQLVWSYTPPVLALSLLSLMLELMGPTSAQWPRITESLKIIFQIGAADLEKCRRETMELLREHWRWRGERPLLSASRWIRPPLLETGGRKVAKKQRSGKMPSGRGGIAAKQRKSAAAFFEALSIEPEDGEEEEEIGEEEE